VILYWPWWY